MKVRPANDGDIRFVFANCREHNRRELTAARWTDDPASVAEDVIGMRAAARCLDCYAADDGEAVAIFALFEIGPGLGMLAIVMTDRWPEIAFASAYAFKEAQQEAFAGFRRVECTVIAGGDHRWLARYGFETEGLARRRGKHGEDFIHYAWVSPAG